MVNQALEDIYVEGMWAWFSREIGRWSALVEFSYHNSYQSNIKWLLL